MSVNSKMTAIANAIRSKTGETSILTLDEMANAISSIPTGVELNFDVVGGTTAPTNPKENTIWVNTSTAITGYYFAANQPGNMAEGAVWFFTGNVSVVGFNALQENGIQVYPISAKQYVNGAWVDKTAKSYQNGAWVEWITYLYNKGNQCTNITGGWITYKHSSYPGASTTTFEDSCIRIVAAETAAPGIYTKNKIDVSKMSTIHVACETVTGNCKLFVFLSNTAGSFTQDIAFVELAATGDLDVSSINGTYYLNLWLPINQGKPATTKKIMEVYGK